MSRAKEIKAKRQQKNKKPNLYSRALDEAEQIDFELAAGCPERVITRTWTATDACGNASSCVQTITVVDTQAPLLAGCPTLELTIECSDPLPVAATVTATDNCDEDVPVSYTQTITAGACPDTYTVTRVWIAMDDCGNAASCTQVIHVQDTTTPVITGCRDDITVNAEAGTCSAHVSWTEPTAMDNCSTPVRTRSHVPGDVFPVGTTTVIYTFEDECDHVSTCEFDVTVLAYNDLVVDIELQGDITPAELARCITFTFVDCPSGTPVTLHKEMTFTRTAYSPPGVGNRGVAHVVFDDLPCGTYDCVTAEDELHSLTVQVAPGISGGDWTVDFTGANMLVQGDLIDIYDGARDYVDILDFGVYINQWGWTGSSGTTCATGFPHADMDGDGGISAGDFAFITANFWQLGDPLCCAGAARGDGADGGPRDSISVKELVKFGLGELAIADLNGDGVVDLADVEAFMAGVRPKPVPAPAALSNTAQPATPAAAPGLLELIPDKQKD